MSTCGEVAHTNHSLLEICCVGRSGLHIASSLSRGCWRSEVQGFRRSCACFADGPSNFNSGGSWFMTLKATPCLLSHAAAHRHSEQMLTQANCFPRSASSYSSGSAFCNIVGLPVGIAPAQYGNWRGWSPPVAYRLLNNPGPAAAPGEATTYLNTLCGRSHYAHLYLSDQAT